MLTLERSNSMELQGQMRKVCFRMETLNIKIAQIGDTWPRGGQTLLLRESHQPDFPQPLQNEYNNSQASDPDLSLKISTSPISSQPQSSWSEGMTGHDVRTFNLTRSFCEQECCCACHKRGRVRSPSYLNTVLGSLLIGYCVLPWITRICDNNNCGGCSPYLAYTYAFPQWLLNRVVAFRLAYDRSKGPELCLRIIRMRASHDFIFRVAGYRGDTTGEAAVLHLKTLFANGEASVLDVDPYGRTALHVRSKPPTSYLHTRI